jgi:rubrerythrin
VIPKTAYISEKLAYLHYVGYSRKAVEEKYSNIAYLFTAFAVSEKIHAENYKRILTSLSAGSEEPESEILILKGPCQDSTTENDV